MSRTFDCRVPDQRKGGIVAATHAVRRGSLVVMPTDTVYGLGCDAFRADAVTSLLSAKGRGRDMPVPVLVGSTETLSGVAGELSLPAHRLAEAFWPGGLTLVCHQQPSVQWDLGETGGTVAVRMPLHPVALEVIQATGPMAVSSANRSGRPPAATAAEAREQLGDAVAVYLEGGPVGDLVPSTIVDVTGSTPVVLREGTVPVDLLREVVPELAVPA
ncbi:MAG TPA: L-threonylcarbamoyladenylate synthase [Jiangellales bacterium]|nr:L-threonylcarbamoyladenylate synthase [Jiangellales bacterium]